MNLESFAKPRLENAYLYGCVRKRTTSLLMHALLSFSN